MDTELAARLKGLIIELLEDTANMKLEPLLELLQSKGLITEEEAQKVLDQKLT